MPFHFSIFSIDFPTPETARVALESSRFSRCLPRPLRIRRFFVPSEVSWGTRQESPLERREDQQGAAGRGRGWVPHSRRSPDPLPPPPRPSPPPPSRPYHQFTASATAGCTATLTASASPSFLPQPPAAQPLQPPSPPPRHLHRRRRRHHRLRHD
eukprot:2291874-Prymnesium_polylepis.1